MAIRIEFLSNVIGFLRGTRDMSQALDDTQDALEDSAREARKLGDELGDEVSKGARDGRSAVDRLRDTMRQLGRTTSDTADDARKDFRKMGDNVEGFKDEAKQNFAEVASSWKGDLEGMTDGVQGLTGGLASSLTPGIGIPVAILGATAAAFMQSWIDATEESKERVSEAYRAFLEAGSRYLTDQQTNDAIADLADDADKYAQALKISEQTGMSVQAVLRAMVGDQTALNEAIAAENQAHADKLAAIQNGTAAAEDQAAAILLENQRHADSIGLLERVATDTQAAADKAATVAAAFGTGNDALDRQIAKIQGIAAQLDGMGNKTIKIDADTTGVEGALSRLQGRTISVNVNGQITRIGNQVWN